MLLKVKIGLPLLHQGRKITILWLDHGEEVKILEFDWSLLFLTWHILSQEKICHILDKLPTADEQCTKIWQI